MQKSKIIVLGGFLGSGKTSILLPLAKYLSDLEENTPSSVAIIENEIGKVSIDGISLRQSGLMIRELFSGCICCTLGVDLIQGLKELEETQHPKWIIIEATGLAYPSAITDNISKHCPQYSWIRTCVLVDAKRYDRLFDTVSVMAKRQVREADLVLLNKTDLVSRERADDILEELKQINATAEYFKICAKDGLEEKLLLEITRGDLHDENSHTALSESESK